MKSGKISTANEIGWREWVALPGLGIPAIKAKVDTGAKTSALHTYHLETFVEAGVRMVRFCIHPLQKRTDISITCLAPVIDLRPVKDSGGHIEERYVISTLLRLAGKEWPIEITLTRREDMLFRMLIGRKAMLDADCWVNPGKSYLTGKLDGSVYAHSTAGTMNENSHPVT